MKYLLRNVLSVVLLLVGFGLVFAWEQIIPDQTKLNHVSGKIISVTTSGKSTLIWLSAVEKPFALSSYFGHGCRPNESRSKIGMLIGKTVSIQYSREFRRKYFTKIEANIAYSLVASEGYACTYLDIDTERRNSNNNAQVGGYIFILLGLFQLLKKSEQI